jgi:hypothetical protein
MAVAGSAREVRAEAERPARAAGTRALCAIVSDMVGQQPQVCLPLAGWFVEFCGGCGLAWLACTKLEFWRRFVTELQWLQLKTHQVARRRQCLLLVDPPLAAGIGLGLGSGGFGVDSYRRKSMIAILCTCRSTKDCGLRKFLHRAGTSPGCYA